MRIAEIEIGNFRSIYRQNFKPSNVNILLGENDVGKSNILHALNLFFNPRKRARFSDIHANIKSNLLSIKLTFEVDNQEEVNKPLRSHLSGKKLIMHRKHRVNRSTKYYGHNNKEITKTDLLNFFRDKCSFFYIPTVRDASQHEKTVELIHELIENPSESVGNSVLEDAREATKKLDRHMSKYLKDFTSLLRKNLKMDDVEITFAPEIDEILQLAKIRIGQSGFASKLQSRGQGIQSLTLINLYRAMANAKRSGLKITAFEEPEAHLHPNLLRSFAQDLFSNAENLQIFLTTHSPFIVDQAKLSNIVRIVARDLRSHFIQPNRKQITKTEPTFYKYVHAKQSHIFFAKHVLLVEGPSDRHFLTIVSSKITYLGRYRQKKECNFEINGITALENEGKSFKKKILLLELFKIPWTVLCDKDAWKGKNPLINLLRETKIGQKKPRKFSRLENFYKEGHDLNLNIKKLLEEFNIFCLSGKLEDFIITPNSKPKVKKILKQLFPKSIRSSGDNELVADEDLKEILSKEKTTWPKPLATEFVLEDIHEEIAEAIRRIAKRAD